MSDIVTRLLAAYEAGDCLHGREAADEIERLRKLIADYQHNLAESADNDGEIERLRDQLHHCNGTCDLAMKHRDRAEALNAELLAALKYVANRDPLISGDAWDMRKAARAAIEKAEGHE